MSKPEPWQNNAAMLLVNRLLDSFEHWTGKSLLSQRRNLNEDAGRLFLQPFIVLAHGTEPDPLLSYANRAALELWGWTWEQALGTPTRLTAEPALRDERARFIERVSRHGHVDDYHGVRISSQGKRFEILRATVWNILDGHGNITGQAATFGEIRFLN